MSSAAERSRPGTVELVQRAASCGLVTGQVARAEPWSGNLGTEVERAGDWLAWRGTHLVMRETEVVARLAWGDTAELCFGRQPVRHGAEEDRADVVCFCSADLGDLLHGEPHCLDEIGGPIGVGIERAVGGAGDVASGDHRQNVEKLG